MGYPEMVGSTCPECGQSFEVVQESWQHMVDEHNVDKVADQYVIGAFLEFAVTNEDDAKPLVVTNYMLESLSTGAKRWMTVLASLDTATQLSVHLRQAQDASGPFVGKPTLGESVANFKAQRRIPGWRGWLIRKLAP